MLAYNGEPEPVGVPVTSASSTQQAQDPAVQAHLLVLDHGRRAPGFDSSARWLVEHPEQSHAAMLESLRSGGPGHRVIPGLLAAIGWPESVPVLAEAARSGSAQAVGAAASALARHPAADAGPALVGLLSEARAETVQAALVALRERGDLAASACPGVLQHLAHPDGVRRAYALRAAWALQCIDRAAREGFSEDPHADVQAVAAELLAG